MLIIIIYSAYKIILIIIIYYITIISIYWQPRALAKQALKHNV